MGRFALTIFLSAFLLFQVQPLICKFILPWFGGTPAVWTTCMLFFQVLLVGGYAYAHFSAGKLTPRTQARLHVGLLLACLLLLPILPSAAWRPAADEEPVSRILCLLLATVGAPYLLLSATAPLLQAWVSRRATGTEAGPAAASPYRLYALSNAGSLLALLSYPFLVEPNLALRTQVYVWSGGFAVFAVCCAWCALTSSSSAVNNESKNAATPLTSEGGDASRPGKTDRILWLAYPACGSVLLLATTNQLSLDVASVPFLWVLPLSLYLLSFIICFDHQRWYSRPLWNMALIPALGGAYFALKTAEELALWHQIILYSLALFVCCMVCHGELYRLKPSPRRLTSYYLMTSIGGALGGAAVSLLAPMVFTTYWEYPIGLLVCGALLLVGLFRDENSALRRAEPLWAWAVILALYAAFAGVLISLVTKANVEIYAQTRNFYGVLRVQELYDGDTKCGHLLRHGRITHGLQFRDEPRRHYPTSYYGNASGIGVALDVFLELEQQEKSDQPGTEFEVRPGDNRRIGVIGLGAGTVAAYGRKGDFIRFYEINPDVLRLSDEYFTYRRDTEAQVEVSLGDARIVMERQRDEQQPQNFDVLVVDAFSSDAIPFHLLTREAFALYFYHLRPGGVLAVHISNRFLDLKPVVQALSADAGKRAVLIDNDEIAEHKVWSSTWVLVTDNKKFLAAEILKANTESWGDKPRPPVLFTDDYSNLFKVLKK